MRNALHRTALLAGTSALLALATPALAGGVDAGTLIANTAQATFDRGTGTETVQSNTVSLRVDELLDVTLTSLDPGPVAASPGTVVLTYELTNTGNGPEAFSLVANGAVAGNDTDLRIDAIAIDSNGNGTYDPGVDQVLTEPATTAALAADAVLTIFVVATVANTAQDGDQAQVELRADAVTGSGASGTTFAGAGVGGGNAVVGATGASATARGAVNIGVATVSLSKSAAVADPFGGTSAVPGAIVTYTIVAAVSGNGTVTDLLVTDSFPAGTTYQPGTLAIDGNPLSDAAGDDAGEADATGISVDLGDPVGGTSRAISFAVVVNP